MSLKKSVLTVFQGTVIAQVIGFLALPLLTRLFTPEAFGEYQIFTTIVAFILVIAVLRYEIAIVSADNDEEAASLGRLCLGINLGLTVLVTLLCLILSLVHSTVSSQLGAMLWLLPVAVLLCGLLQITTYLALRFQDFRITARSKITQASSYSLTALVLGWLSSHPVGLMLADLVGRLGGVLCYAVRPFARSVVKRTWSPELPRLRQVAYKYRNFPAISLPGALVNTAGSMVTPFLIYRTFDAATAGQYALVDRSFSLPLGLVTQAVSQVFMSSFAASLRSPQGGAPQLFQRIVSAHLKWGSIPMLIVMLAAPVLFPLLFGQQWRLAGEFCRIMAPLFLVSFMTAPVNMALTLLGRQKLQMAWDVGRLVSVCGIWLLIGYWKLDSRWGVLLHVCVNVMAYLVFLVLVYHAVGRQSLHGGGDREPGRGASV